MTDRNRERARKWGEEDCPHRVFYSDTSGQPYRQSKSECPECLTALLDEVEAKRDGEWRRAAGSHFDGIRSNAELIEMYAGGNRDLPQAIAHEIWKRDPRVEELICERDEARGAERKLKQCCDEWRDAARDIERERDAARAEVERKHTALVAEGEDKATLAAEVERLRAIISPGDAAAFEEHMATREAYWVAQNNRLRDTIKDLAEAGDRLTRYHYQAEADLATWAEAKRKAGLR